MHARVRKCTTRGSARAGARTQSTDATGARATARCSGGAHKHGRPRAEHRYNKRAGHGALLGRCAQARARAAGRGNRHARRCSMRARAHKWSA
eukprot:6726186-Alexandrium_andersonii.AAC.1